MNETALSLTTDAPAPAGASRLSLVSLWSLALILLVAGLGNPVVQRTQEARVLETARELVGADARQWLVPRLNTELRLRKPPLAYWAAAGMFEMFGVSEWAGRLPFAIAGWLTIAVVYQVGRLLFDRRVGLMAGLAMGASFFTFRFARLAETDVLASLFVTAAVWLIILGAREERGRRWVVWLQLAGLCIGLAGLAKGLQAAFPILFALVWAAVERDRRLLVRLGASGALVTAVVVGGWWFAYLRAHDEWAVIRDAIAVTASGEDHPGPWYSYVPQTLAGATPWGGVLVLGILWAGVRLWGQFRPPREPGPPRRGFEVVRADGATAPPEDAAVSLPGVATSEFPPAWDAGLRALACWGLTIFLPLCFNGNKQFHYLVPMAGPVAVTVAYAVEAGRRSGGRRTAGEPGAAVRAELRAMRARRGLAIVLGGTVAVCALSAPGIIYAARKQRGLIQTIDLILAAWVLAATAVTILAWRRRGIGAGAVALAVGAGVGLAGVFGWWYPSLSAVTHRTAAADIRRAFGDGPYVFYGKENVSYPLIFNLRTVAPRAQTPAELEKVLAAAPRGIGVIAQTKNKVAPPPIPAGLVERVKAEIGDEGMVIRVYGRE